MYKLVISDDEGKITVVPLVRDEITIGRKEGNTIRLTDRNVSRRHARLRSTNGHYILEDLGSYTGVRLNGARISTETQIAPGDSVRIGDYALKLELESDQPPAASSDDSRAKQSAERRSSPGAQAGPPARVVMLAGPTPGAEFSLPEGAIRVGRSDELHIPLQHRSVSREHAELLRKNGTLHVRDLASANGLRVNGEPVEEATLSSGDVLQLGEVALRFVPEGETYRFDAAEAARYATPAPWRRASFVGLGAAAVIGGIVVATVLSSEELKPSTQALPDMPHDVDDPEAAQPRPAASAAPAESFDEALASCREALQGGRYAQAIAHANRALGQRENAPRAVKCKETAEQWHDQEQQFLQGKEALANGEVESAFMHFSALTEEGPFYERAEVVEARRQYAEQLLEQAQGALGSRPNEARQLASRVLEIETLPSELRGQAQSIQDKASKPAVAQATKSRRAARSASNRRARRKRARAKKTAKPKRTPMQIASQCLTRGDHACVIRALVGKTSSPQELALLIETYRSVGDTASALRHMKTYLRRYPNGSRADTYRGVLERHGGL